MEFAEMTEVIRDTKTIPVLNMTPTRSPMNMRAEFESERIEAPALASAVSLVVSGPMNTLTCRGRAAGTDWSSGTPRTKSCALRGSQLWLRTIRAVHSCAVLRARILKPVLSQMR